VDIGTTEFQQLGAAWLCYKDTSALKKLPVSDTKSSVDLMALEHKRCHDYGDFFPIWQRPIVACLDVLPDCRTNEEKSHSDIGYALKLLESSSRVDGFPIANLFEADAASLLNIQCQYNDQSARR
jgi:hypothetical protein